MRKAIGLLVAAALCAAVLPLRAAAAPQDGSLFGTARLKDAGYPISDTGCTLFIDLDNHNLLVYMDGKPQQAYPVSGGTNETPSPVGTWHVVEISNWGEGFGGTWIGLDVPWGKYGIHGTVKPWFVGESNVSHGCIRMRDADVWELRKFVTLGTLVHIIQNTAPFRELAHGMAGGDVMKVQQLLKQLGFYTGAVDGIYGDATELAIRKFQWRGGLKEDGIVGRTTYNALRERTSAVKE